MQLIGLANQTLDSTTQQQETNDKTGIVKSCYLPH